MGKPQRIRQLGADIVTDPVAVVDGETERRVTQTVDQLPGAPKFGHRLRRAIASAAEQGLAELYLQLEFALLAFASLVIVWIKAMAWRKWAIASANAGRASACPPACC